MTERIPTAAAGVGSEGADNDPHSSVEINGVGTTPLATAAVSPGSRLMAHNGGGAEQANQSSSSSSSVSNGGRSICDNHNKIVIKAKRSVTTAGGESPAAGQQEQEQQQRKGESNELVSGNDVEDIQQLYETKPEAFRQWLLQKAPSDLLTRIRHHETSSKQSHSSDLFQRWIAFSPTKVRAP